MRKSIMSNRGITMLEIMIGVVIVGIAASMAVPNFQKAMDRINFRSTNRDIVSTLRLARSAAISSRMDHGVYFDMGSRTVTYFAKDVPGGEVYEPGLDSVIRVDTLGQKLDWLVAMDSTGSGAYIFRSNGSASKGGWIWTARFTPDMAGLANVDILAATGRTKLQTWVY